MTTIDYAIVVLYFADIQTKVVLGVTNGAMIL